MAIHNFKGNKEMQPYIMRTNKNITVNTFIDYHGQESLTRTTTSQSLEREKERLQTDQRKELIERIWS